MTLFKKQPGFCCVCGKEGLFAPSSMGFIHDNCITEYQWRDTLYVLGKEYYKRELVQEKH